MDFSGIFEVDRGTGLLAPAELCLSPNRDSRPPGATLDLLVVHGISLPPGQFIGRYVEDFFLNRLDPTADPFFVTIKDLRVSAHLYIRRDGGVVQFVPFHERAWHAGKSVFEHRDACNDFSIGVEMEGADDVPYTAVQYSVLAAIIGVLKKSYPTLNALVGHSDIAPGRKTDPGPAFDWATLAQRLPG